MNVRPRPLPKDALLQRYAESGAYTDCFAVDCAEPISHAQFVEAFYTTWLFKLERVILKWAASRPSTDAEARQLANGSIDAFAAWTVEARSDNQILLCDMHERTRSWLMTAPLNVDDGDDVRLYFGSAVVSAGKDHDGNPKLGRAYRALLGFHKIYSKLLLQATQSRLRALTARRR